MRKLKFLQAYDKDKNISVAFHSFVFQSSDSIAWWLVRERAKHTNTRNKKQ
jgi:hypothetical protein